jgi:hypothetical protein
MADYQQHKVQFTKLQEKLTSVKDKVQQQHQTEQLHKQKKKPRPTEQGTSYECVIWYLDESFR